MPIFCVKSVKIYTGQKNLHEYIRGIRDKYEVCGQPNSKISVFFDDFPYKFLRFFLLILQFILIPVDV